MLVPIPYQRRLLRVQPLRPYATALVTLAMVSGGRAEMVFPNSSGSNSRPSRVHKRILHLVVLVDLLFLELQCVSELSLEETALL